MSERDATTPAPATPFQFVGIDRLMKCEDSARPATSAPEVGRRGLKRSGTGGPGTTLPSRPEPTLQTEGDIDPYTLGLLEGVDLYSYSSSEPWAENGVRYVGTAGRTLREAKREILRIRGYDPDAYGAFAG